MTQKISSVIITFNEEENIAGCIESLKPVADEIIVVDSNSTDRTGEICKEKGVTFIQHAFEGHIEQKNWAVQQAAYPVILSLDADEVLSPQLQQSILKVKEEWNRDGYSFNRFNNYCGKWIKHCGWYPDRKIRLWHRDKGKWGGNNPHDKVVMSPGTTLGFLQGDLLHYSFHSIRQHMDQINKFSDIKANVAFNKGKRSNYLKLIFLPFFKFIRNYFLKAGFLDGFYGWVICVNSAHSEFLKYAKLKHLQNK